MIAGALPAGLDAAEAARFAGLHLLADDFGFKNDVAVHDPLRRTANAAVSNGEALGSRQ